MIICLTVQVGAGFLELLIDSDGKQYAHKFHFSDSAAGKQWTQQEVHRQYIRSLRKTHTCPNYQRCHSSANCDGCEIQTLNGQCQLCNPVIYLERSLQTSMYIPANPGHKVKGCKLKRNVWTPEFVASFAKKSASTTGTTTELVTLPSHLKGKRCVAIK